MASFKFEAMDTTGTEVKDSVDAATEEEAQQKIRQMGYFVTKITQVAAKKGGKDKKKGGKKKRGFTIGGVDWHAHLGGLLTGAAITKVLLSSSSRK